MTGAEKSDAIASQIVSLLLESGQRGRDLSVDDLDVDFEVEFDHFDNVVRYLCDMRIMRYQTEVLDTENDAKTYYLGAVLLDRERAEELVNKARARQGDRRLAAVLAADVVGYSKLVGADESGTQGNHRAQAQCPYQWGHILSLTAH